MLRLFFYLNVGDCVDGNLAVLKLVTCVMYEMLNDCGNVEQMAIRWSVWKWHLIAALSFYDLIVVVDIMMVAKILKW